MSLRATTTLCRHLQPHLTSRTIRPHLRHFSSTTKGSGLRRIRNTGRVTNASTPPPTASPLPNPSANAATSSAEANPLKVDPHAIANEMIQGSSSARPSGSEAVASSLTSEQKMSNYAMAGGLLAFVSYVFYYSLASVGGADNAKQVMFGGGGNKQEGGDALATNAGFAEFLKEAKEGMEEEEARLTKERKAQGEADKLVDLDRTEGTLSREEEREMARVAGFEEEMKDVKRRPLWRRVVFFWRRE
ncbi:hypothetical protein ACHAXN_012884 [Cyclotella atomus]